MGLVARTTAFQSNPINSYLRVSLTGHNGIYLWVDVHRIVLLGCRIFLKIKCDTQDYIISTSLERLVPHAFKLHFIHDFTLVIQW